MSDERLFWDKIAGIYNSMFAKNKAYQKMYNLILEHLDKSMQVLELGTGTGLIAKKVCGLVQSVVATDFSADMIEQAKVVNSSDNIEYSVQDARALPYKDNSFDSVIISNVLHIVPNPKEILQEIKRVLREDGILIAPTYMWKEISFLGRIKKFFMLRHGFPLYSEWETSCFIQFLETQGFQISNKTTIKSAFDICFVVCKLTK